MQNALLIAEKPSLRKKIEAVYNAHKSEIPYQITFTEQRGHLVTLMLPDEIDEEQKKWCWENLPFHPEDHGGWQYKVIQEPKTGKFLTAQERYENIKSEIRSGKYDFIINAGDPDQEGELLIRTVLEKAKNKLPIKRFWTNDVTDTAILDALKNLRDDDHEDALINLLKAARGRQHSDYRYGMNISEAVSLKLNMRAACGRVKTPILAMVCKREDEIENFKPTTKYGIKVNYTEGFSGQLFSDSAVSEESDEDSKDDTEKGLIWFDTKEEAERELREISEHDRLRITSFTSTKKETYAPKLFKLATAQVAAGKLGFSPSAADEIIQALYERGYITYPRTDCEYLSSHDDLTGLLKSAYAVPSLVPYISSIDKATIGKVSVTKKWVNDAELKEHGHSALVPTTSKPDFSSLTSDEQAIYEMICKQFVAIFLPPVVQNKIELISTDDDGHLFKSTGSVVVDKGYSVIFDGKFVETAIPTHSKGDLLEVLEYEFAEKTSVCPKRYTQTDLIAACESPAKYLNDASLKTLGKKLKIGTPATRAGIIDMLITKDKYLCLEKDGKRTVVVPTKNGKFLYNNVKSLDICKVDMTGIWEIMLEDVRSGKMEFDDFERTMRKDVEKMLNEVSHASMEAVERTRIPVVCECPLCGGEILSGAKGFFCSNYKKGCKAGGFKLICDSTVTDSEFKKLISGEVIEKTLKKGSSSWKQKLAYNMTDCKIEFVKSEDRGESGHSSASKTAYKCPKCGGEIVESGKALSCVNKDFTLWKTVCQVELTPEQIEKFFTTGNTGVVKNMVSKKGSKFNASLKLNAAKDGTEFVFS